MQDLKFTLNFLTISSLLLAVYIRQFLLQIVSNFTIVMFYFLVNDLLANSAIVAMPICRKILPAKQKSVLFGKLMNSDLRKNIFLYKQTVATDH